MQPADPSALQVLCAVVIGVAVMIAAGWIAVTLLAEKHEKPAA